MPMLHAIIVHENEALAIVAESFAAKKIPSENSRFEVYKNANIFIVGWYKKEDLRYMLQSVLEEFIPENIFFIASARGVSDEKRLGDIVLPNVFFECDNAIIERELDEGNRDAFLKKVLFIEHYDRQEDYDFDSFGLSIGGVGVSGTQSMDEDLRIKLRLAYEADVFDRDIFSFVEEAQKLSIGEKIYPIAMVGETNNDAIVQNALHIVRFFIGSLEWEMGELESDTIESDTEIDEDAWDEKEML